MKRRVTVLVTMIVAVLTLAGCGRYTKLSVNKDGEIAKRACYLMTADEYKQYVEEMSQDYSSEDIKATNVGTKTIDGVKYNVIDGGSDEVYTKSDFAFLDGNRSSEGNSFSYSLFSDGYFAYDYALEEASKYNGGAEGWMLPVILEVNFPGKVAKSDNLSKISGTTVTWTITSSKVKSKNLYAYTESFAKKHKPTIKGVKNNKTYDKSVNIKATELDGFKITKVTVDGKAISIAKSGKKVTATVSTVGQHTVEVTNDAGNTRTITFTIK